MKRLFVSAVALTAAAASVAPATTHSTLPFGPGSEPFQTHTRADSGAYDAQSQATTTISDQSAPVTTTKQSVEGAEQTIDTTKANSQKNNSRLITVMGVTWEGEGERDVQYRTRHAQGDNWGDWEQMPVSDDGSDPNAQDHSESTDAIVVAPYEVVQVKSDAPVTVSVSVTERTQVDDIIAGHAIDRPLHDTDTATPEHRDEAGELGATSATNTAYNASGTHGAYSAQNVANVDGLEYVTRSQWGASKPRCDIDHAKRNEGVVIHHTSGASKYSQGEVPGILRGIQAYHQKSRGWCDIGYNMLVDRFGKIYEGRAGGLDKATVGAHAVAVNEGTFGVAVMGTYNKPAPREVLDSLSKVIRWQSQKWGWKVDSDMKIRSAGGPGAKKPEGAMFTLPRVIGHRDVGETDCPVDGLYGQIPEIRRMSTGSPIDEYANKHKLGKPSSDVKTLKDRTDTQARAYGSRLVLANGHGTYRIEGAILNAWKKMGWERSHVGLPTADAVCGLPGGGCYQKFEKGVVHWSKGSGAHATSGAIHNEWAKNKYERGPLGYPIAEEVTKKGVASQKFQYGSITWTSKNGAKVKVAKVSGNAK